ncbi:MAG: DUF4235 domain-containing protein [Solirubrobacterales bacterium]
MNLLFRPFTLLAGVLAGQVAQALFDFVWARIDDEEAPDPAHRYVSWKLLLIAAALRGIVYGVTREVVDRGSRQGFLAITGTWPGDTREEA